MMIIPWDLYQLLWTHPHPTQPSGLPGDLAVIPPWAIVGGSEKRPVNEEHVRK